MSDDDFPDYMPVPPMDTEQGRDAAIGMLLEDGEMPCQCAVIQDDTDMVIRIRYPDGTEEVFDVTVRRAMELVRQAPEGEQN